MLQYGTPICHNCTKKYTRDGTNMPLLLQCGHTFCESCILRFARNIKYAGNINCPECLDVHHIDSVKCVKQMQINSHIYGIITAPNRRTENAVDTMVQDLSNKLSDIAIKQCEEGEDDLDEVAEDYPLCCECSSVSDVHCNECNLPYCEACSVQAHKLVALRNHGPVPVQPKSIFEPCPDHPDATPTHFLTLSGIPVCPLCPPVGDTALIKTSEDMEDLIHRYNVGMEKLLESDQIIAELIPTVEDDFLRLKREVRKGFAYAHGLLQAREHHLLSTLEETQTSTVAPLLDLRYEVAKNKKALRSNFNWVLNNRARRSLLGRRQIKIMEIDNAITEVPTTLCVVSEKRPTYIIKKDILDTCIKEYSYLNWEGVHQYVLSTVQSTEFRRFKDENPPPPPQDDMIWSITTSTPAEPLHVTQSSAQSADIVIVSTVYNPHCFYIQRSKDRDNLDELQNILVRYYGLAATSEDYLSSVSPGDLVSCQFSTDDLWYRAKVVDVTPDNMINVLYVDYGNTENVSLTRLRQLKLQFTHIPALAIKCTLHGVIPRFGENWTSAASESFKRLTDDREFQLITKAEESDHLEVDLQHCGDDSIKDSLRELLVFLEHACFSATTSTPEKEVLELDSVQVEPVDMEWPVSDDNFIDVVVSHMEDPSQFYLQHMAHKETLIRIGEDIHQHMGTVGSKFPLRQLKKATMCIAKFHDGTYYRGVILGAVQFNMDILYCDYGNVASVPRDWLFEIPQLLTLPPKQAMQCSLYGVLPSSNAWAETEKIEFDRLAYTQRTVFAKLEKTEDSVYLVSLIDTTQGSDDIDVAVEMIRLGAATPTMEDKPEPSHLKLGDLNMTREVTICNVDSPGLIHVNLTHVPYPPFFQELNLAYTSLVATGNNILVRHAEWKVGDMCVAFLAKLNVYIRAKILEICHADIVVVENVDQGKTSEVTLNDIKPLVIDFQHQHKFAVKCHLHDVKPCAGDEWSTEEKKFIHRFFSRRLKKEGTCFFVTVMGERDRQSKSWPVDIVVCNPQKTEKIRISEEIVKSGYAVSLRRATQPIQNGYMKQTLQSGSRPISAKVSHVSSDCTIYIQLDTQKEALARLTSELVTSAPKHPDDIMWEVGSCCTVNMGGVFFRGLVASLVGDHMLEVHLVDVGTDHQLSKDVVFPALVAPLVPVQAVPCQLAYIEPAWYSGDGTWSNAAAEYMYEALVDETCNVLIVDAETDTIAISLTLKSGKDISKSVVDKGYGINTRTPPVVENVLDEISLLSNVYQSNTSNPRFDIDSVDNSHIDIEISQTI